MPAGLLSIGDYSLSVDAVTQGREGVAVVFVAGTGGDSADSFAAVTALLDDLPVVCYARPGLGRSEPAPVTTPRGVRAAARELHALLRTAEIPAPWVLVGHSYGALICEVFAAEWPQEAAGLVLVDGSDAQLNIDLGRPLVDDGDEAGTIPFNSVVVAADMFRARRATITCPVAVVASRPGRWLDVTPADDYHPLTLAEMDHRWQAHQAASAHRLGGDLFTAQFGGHHVQRDDPELVARAIRHVHNRVGAPGRRRDLV